MASTFDENKKMKCDQSPCQSWFKHIGIEKSNNYTVQFFSAHRNTKTKSKSDESTDLSTTDQGNGQDTGLEDDEPAEDPDPDLHPLRSDWNELCLVCCDKCDYLYAHQAFMWHQEVRHLLQQDPSLYQHRLYKKKPKPTPAQERKQRRKAKNGKKSTIDRQNKKPVRTDDSKNNDSEANVVNETDVMAGPGPGSGTLGIDPPFPGHGKNKKENEKRKRKRSRLTYGPKRRKRIVHESNVETSVQNVTESVIEVLENYEKASLQIVTENSIKEPESRLEVNCQLKGAQNYIAEYPIDVESLVLPVVHGCSMQLEDVSHCGNFPSENLVINQSTNSKKMLSVPPLVNNIINSKAKDCSNSENTQSLFCKIKLPNLTLTKNNIFSYNNSLIHNSSPSKMGRSLNEDDARNKLKSHTVSGCALPNDCASDIANQNVIHEKLHNGTQPKRFNGNLKKESAQRNSSVICVETLKQDSSFHNENNAYLDCLGDGSQLSSRKCVRKTKPDVKLKSQQIKEKLKTALASPVYEQCLQTIKLEPIKIKKALSSINRVCKARTIEQFRTFSHLKHIMPSGKISPHRTRVSCSVNTGAKSACIKSWNKVPFRYQSRKCFFPLGGGHQTESGLVLSDSPYKTLRATFNQNELDTSPIQFQESDFVTTVTPDTLYQSTVEIGELNDEGFAALEPDIYEGQQNGSLPSPNVNSPWNSDLRSDNQPDSGYLSQYDHQQQMLKGSPISSTSSPEFWDHQETELLNPASILREGSSQIILLYPKDLNRKDNGINGTYQDYNREQNHGCKDR